MKTIDVDTWEEFERQVQVLIQERMDRKTSTGRGSPEFLYRGHSNYQWPLETTLEREGEIKCTMTQYHRLICRVRSQIESFTANRWDVPSPLDFENWLGQSDPPPFFQVPAYDYLAYLRHHGFPSPLLDWTRSPYVAAYFAFAYASKNSDRVSIYVYWESSEGIKGGCVGEPEIVSLGPYIRTHRRHFLQQSQYTCCVARDSVTSPWHYAPHESAFLRDEPDQDILWKCTIPATERLKVLRLLDGYNLNGYSLFGSEESLMHTMALRELHFRKA